ncbi:PAS domain S-box-containing protein [Rhodopseudomonas julia]|uniref:histidine kinase n=1 Tax=Rhodopseudomonas julia TaxID=200617 RepID=A0ABU0C329_9BRAD|nr:histidine kinase dimerization/phospho-acceptor domain-containing protein [Rhodopseudomonas julia]MDQ0324880.1 PAS domain S-box-containing protein [Rhodopseudomonas julia]
MQSEGRGLVEAMADERLAALVSDARPAMFFRLDDNRLGWLNPAAAERLGCGTAKDALTLGLGSAEPLKRDIRMLAKTAGETGSLGRLRLGRGFGAVPVVCQCQRVVIGGERGLLAVAIAAGHAPNLARMPAFFSGDGVAARLVEASELEGRTFSAGKPQLVADWPHEARLRQASLIPVASETCLAVIDLESDFGPVEAGGGAAGLPQELDEPATGRGDPNALERPATDVAAPDIQPSDTLPSDVQAPDVPANDDEHGEIVEMRDPEAPVADEERLEREEPSAADPAPGESDPEETGAAGSRAAGSHAAGSHADGSHDGAPDDGARTHDEETDLTEAVRRALPAWIADRLTTYDPEKHSAGEARPECEGAPFVAENAVADEASAPDALSEAKAEAEPAPASSDEGSPETEEVAEVSAADGRPEDEPAREEAAEDDTGEQEPDEEEAGEPVVAEEKPAAGEGDEAAPEPAPVATLTRPVSVRFLWQSDASHRILFVSQGLTQLVGRNSEVVGETWDDAAARLRLDPTGRVAKAFHARDTWSGLTAWWPSEAGDIRIPTELTALPVFDADRAFQGFRGFGVLRPAEALKAEAFDLRFPEGAETEETPAGRHEREGEAPPNDNVVPIRSDVERLPEWSRLSTQEKRAFETIASALGARVTDLQPSSGSPIEERRDGLKERQQEAADEAEASGSEIEPSEEGAPAEEPTEAEGDDFASLEARQDSESPSTEVPETVVETTSEDNASEDAAPVEAPITLSNAVLSSKVGELQAILDTALDGVIVLDAEGRVESLNRSAEALFGLEADAVVGNSFTELLEQESRVEAEAYLESLRVAGIKSLLNEGREVLGRTKGGPIPLFMTFGQVGSGERPRFCAVLRDITQWKETETRLQEARAEAERASSQKSDFLARISHEIRTPLNAIIGFAELMVEERFGPIENQRYREYLRDIRASSEHVVSLVNDLLDIARVEAGKLDLDFSAVDLNTLARETVSLMQPQAGRHRVIIRTSLAPDLPSVVADARTLRQILLNLLSNSVKYTDAGGQVILSTRLEENGEVVLRMRDNGGGMSESELARAMEPFRQIITSAIGTGTGSGLGLPLTKALVEANRAQFVLKSARGEGTIAEVAFPATRVLFE